jgi:extracellular elastinolytic metalloproteinase
MIPEEDTREADFVRGSPERQGEITAVAREVSDRLGLQGCEVARLNPATATVAELRCSGGAASDDGHLTVAAQRYVQATSPALGSGPDDVFEFGADPVVQRTSGGAAIVHLRQLYRGVPVFQMTRTVIFGPDPGATKVTGDHAPLPATLNTVPVVNTVRAVQAAGAFVAAPGEGGQAGEPQLPEAWMPRVVAAFALPSQPTVLDAEPFVDPTLAHLVVFYQGPGARLGWQIRLTLPPTETSFGDQCVVVVSADQEEPEILFSRGTAHTAVEGDVFERDPVRTPRARTAFPVPAAAYRMAPPSPAFPKDWCYDNETDGRNVRAVTELTEVPAQGTRDGETVLFSSDDPEGHAQRLINVFYFCNYLHDFFELLGFNEEAGNFEAGSATATGAPGDPVKVLTADRQLLGEGYNIPSPDGASPKIGIGFYGDTGRHMALDFTLVAHEYTHGVVDRLVGGPGDDVSLAAPQSEGLSEGIADFFAIDIVNFRRGQNEPELQVIGDWLTGTTGELTGTTGGIRRHPYDSSYPGTYGQLGTDQYRKRHDIGELWCATMMELVRRWSTRFDEPLAHQLCWQVILDSLGHLESIPPSFLDARKAMDVALGDQRDTNPFSKIQLGSEDQAAARRLLWETFARFGMGFGATTSGAQLEGIVGDTTLPPDLQ